MNIPFQDTGAVGITSTIVIAGLAVKTLIEAKDILSTLEPVSDAIEEALKFSSTCCDCEDIALCCLVG